MESKRQLYGYVLTFHCQYMTKREWLAQRHLIGTLKATRRDDAAAQAEARNDDVFKTFLSSDPDVLQLSSEGYDAFIERTASRILKDHGAALVFNRCPRCKGLARTPTARQCRFCGHDWH
jgi:hypothetical protein